MITQKCWTCKMQTNERNINKCCVDYSPEIRVFRWDIEVLCNVYNVYDLCDATPNISQTITYTLLYFGYILKERTKTRSRNRAKKRAEALKHNWKFHIHHTRAPKKKRYCVCSCSLGRYILWCDDLYCHFGNPRYSILKLWCDSHINSTLSLWLTQILSN